MNRYWVSWWSGNYEDEGCTNPPFQFWLTGQRERPLYGLGVTVYNNLIEQELSEEEFDKFIDEHGKDECSFCAMVDADNEKEIWAVIKHHFPDYEERFCEHVARSKTPGDRFGDFQNRTSLKVS